MMNAIDFLLCASDSLSFRLCLDGTWTRLANWEDAIKKVRTWEKHNGCKLVVCSFDLYTFEEFCISAVLIPK